MQTDGKFCLLFISVLPVRASETVQSGHKPSADMAGRKHTLPVNGDLCSLDPSSGDKGPDKGWARVLALLCFPKAVFLMSCL